MGEHAVLCVLWGELNSLSGCVVPWSSHSSDSVRGGGSLRSQRWIQAGYFRSGTLVIPEQPISDLLLVNQWGRWSDEDGSARSDLAVLCVDWQTEVGYSPTQTQVENCRMFQTLKKRMSMNDSYREVDRGDIWTSWSSSAPVERRK